nr:amino acid racemase [Gluconacetobacter asukensis]
MPPKLVGVLGGMGPAATVDFMQQVICSTTASCDQDHVPLLIFSDPTIPDRSRAIIDAMAPSPVRMLCDHAARLEEAGATALVIPCNTAHHFYEQIAGSVTIPVLHIVDAVCQELDCFPGLSERDVAIMATAGTLRSRFYEERLARAGYRLMVPTDEEQAVVNEVIRLIKAGEIAAARVQVLTVVRDLKARGAGVVILGCTELPLIRDVIGELISYIDSTDALAKACLQYVRSS